MTKFSVRIIKAQLKTGDIFSVNGVKFTRKQREKKLTFIVQPNKKITLSFHEHSLYKTNQTKQQNLNKQQKINKTIKILRIYPEIHVKY